jgi:hypothetical protein
MTNTAASTGLTADVITDVYGFRTLEHEWRTVYETSPLATPFQTWDWLYSWWEVYGEPGKLCLVTARRHDRLVGALPLMITASGCLEFIGTGLSDHLDALVDPTMTAEVMDTWVADLQRSSGLRLLDLHEVRPEAVIWRLYDRWPGPKRRFPQSTCAEFDVQPIDDLLAKWSKGTRRAAHVAMNRIAKGGYTEHWAEHHEIGYMADELVARHLQMWEGRGITPAHADPRFRRFVRRVCERMASHDQVGLLRLDPPDDIDDPMQLSELLVVGHEYVGGWLSAHNEAAQRRLTIAVIENIHGIKLATRRGVGVMSMLRGTEEVKLKMHDRTKLNHRLLLAGRGPGATAGWWGRVGPAAAITRLKEWERHSNTGRRVTRRLRAIRDRRRR